MRHPFYKGVLLGSIVAVVTMMAATALAGTGVGAVFNLGKVNKVNRTSYLSGTTSKKMLQVTNKGSGAALGLTVKAGKPPLVVNSTARVKRLNADMVDGLHASDIGRVLSARWELPESSPYTQLTLPDLGRLRFYSSGGDVFTMQFVSSPDEVVHFAKGSQCWDLPPNTNASWTDVVPRTALDDSLDLRFTLWNSKRLATVLGVAATLPGETDVTVIVQAIVQ